jgi:hypothetical protein
MVGRPLSSLVPETDPECIIFSFKEKYNKEVMSETELSIP